MAQQGVQRSRSGSLDGAFSVEIREPFRDIQTFTAENGDSPVLVATFVTPAEEVDPAGGQLYAAARLLEQRALPYGRMLRRARTLETQIMQLGLAIELLSSIEYDLLQAANRLEEFERESREFVQIARRERHQSEADRRDKLRELESELQEKTRELRLAEGNRDTLPKRIWILIGPARRGREFSEECVRVLPYQEGSQDYEPEENTRTEGKKPYRRLYHVPDQDKPSAENRRETEATMMWQWGPGAPERYLRSQVDLMVRSGDEDYDTEEEATAFFDVGLPRADMQRRQRWAFELDNVLYRQQARAAAEVRRCEEERQKTQREIDLLTAAGPEQIRAKLAEFRMRWQVEIYGSVQYLRETIDGWEEDAAEVLQRSGHASIAQQLSQLYEHHLDLPAAIDVSSASDVHQAAVRGSLTRKAQIFRGLTRHVSSDANREDVAGPGDDQGHGDESRVEREDDLQSSPLGRELSQLLNEQRLLNRNLVHCLGPLEAAREQATQAVAQFARRNGDDDTESEFLQIAHGTNEFLRGMNPLQNQPVEAINRTEQLDDLLRMIPPGQARALVTRLVGWLRIAAQLQKWSNRAEQLRRLQELEERAAEGDVRAAGEALVTILRVFGQHGRL